MKELLKVDGHSHLLRDKKTNSIINTNMSEYNDYVSRRNAKNEELKKVEDLNKEMDDIKSDIEEIKFLLRKLANES